MSATRLASVPFTGTRSLVQTPRASHWRSQICLIASDSLTLAILSVIIVSLRHMVTASYSVRSELQFAPLLASTLAIFWLSGLYPAFLLHPAEEMKRIFVGVSFVLFLLTFSTFIWRTSQDYSRAVFLVAWVMSAPALFLTRRLLRRAMCKRPWWGAPAVILGSGESAQRVARHFQYKHLGLNIIGALSDRNAEEWPTSLPPMLGPTSLAPALAASGKAHYAVVAMTKYSSDELRGLIRDKCRGFGHVLLVPDLPGLCSLGVLARDLGGEVALEMPQRLFHSGSAAIKRTVDLCISLLALMALSPVLLLTALTIKFTSRGPIFYSQLRYGQHGEAFRAFKFRTMVVNSQAALAQHLARHPEAQGEWLRDHKLKNDPRITPIGLYLRRFSLDELPQLFNVLAGQMSLVGPRPIVKEEIEKYGQGYDLYCRVLPGITGLWQVSGRNNTTYTERVAFDEFYVNNWSVWLDLYLLLRTIRVVLTGAGAY